MVDGPDASAAGPAQPFLAEAMRVTIIPAVGNLQLDQFPPRKVREESPQRGKTQTRSGVIENVEHGVPLEPGRFRGQAGPATAR